MQTLGQFIVERRKELGLAGREVVTEVRNSDGKPISIPFLVDLEHDRRKPSDEVWSSSPKCLRSIPTWPIWRAGSQPTSQRRTSTAPKIWVPPGKPSVVK
jgi:hypothetical protein